MCQWTKYTLLLGDLKVDLPKEIGRVDLVEPTRLFSHSSQIMDPIIQWNYSVYSIYVDDDGKAAGGSTILRDSILHSYVNLDTDLQAVAVCISLDKTITLCSV